jgi:hypothetical protein
MAEVVSDAPPVTSTVEVIDMITIRTYSDGVVQRNVWESNERAEEYAASVAEVEGAA